MVSAGVKLTVFTFAIVVEYVLLDLQKDVCSEGRRSLFVVAGVKKNVGEMRFCRKVHLESSWKGAYNVPSCHVLDLATRVRLRYGRDGDLIH